MSVSLSMLVEIAFNAVPVINNPKYVPAISVATPEPIKDRFIGVSVNISIKKNATNNSKISEMEMMNFFIAKFRFMDIKICSYTWNCKILSGLYKFKSQDLVSDKQTARWAFSLAL